MGCIQSQCNSVQTDDTDVSLKKSLVPEEKSLLRRLPKDANRVMVKQVYDGDTIVLEDRQRIRLLEVDTPEKGSNWAEEAKAFTTNRIKNSCNRAYISYKEGNVTDKYNRVLAYVFVPVINAKGEETGYICLNEALIAYGLAHCFFTNRKRSNERLLKLQHEARLAGVGKWGDFVDKVGYVTHSGTAFHKDSHCKYVHNIRSLNQMNYVKAFDMGYHPCRNCLANL